MSPQQQSCGQCRRQKVRCTGRWDAGPTPVSQDYTQVAKLYWDSIRKLGALVVAREAREGLQLASDRRHIRQLVRAGLRDTRLRSGRSDLENRLGEGMWDELISDMAQATDET